MKNLPAVLLAAFILAPLAARSEVTPGPVLGINDAAEWTPVEKTSEIVDEDVAANTRFVRTSADWDIFQPGGPGAYPQGYNPTYLVRLDNYFQLCSQHGIRILLLSAYAPIWANGGHKDYGWAPQAPFYKDYAAYCCFLLQHYSSYKDANGVRTLEAIELWNEPDLCDLFFKGYKREQYEAGQAFGQIVLTVGSALKTTRSQIGADDVKILAPSVSDPHSVAWSPQPNHGWLDGFYSVPNVADNYDIFSFHTYWYNAGKKGWQPLEVPSAWNPANQSIATFGKLLAGAKGDPSPTWAEMDAHGDTKKPIWCTESGGGAESNTATQPPHRKGLLLSEEPAVFADEVNLLIDSNKAGATDQLPNYRRLYWFRSTEYQHYGIVDAQGKPKFLYPSYASEAKSGDMEPIARVLDSGFEEPVVKFARPAPQKTPWNFAGGSGIAPIKPAGAPTDAPEGLQTGFIRGTGSISQTLFCQAGAYVLNFQGAQPAGQSANPIQVSVDGTPAGAALTPAGASFGQLTTAKFTIAAAGNHTITLTGTGGGDEAESYVDDVIIARVADPAPTN